MSLLCVTRWWACVLAKYYWVSIGQQWLVLCGSESLCGGNWCNWVSRWHWCFWKVKIWSGLTNARQLTHWQTLKVRATQLLISRSSNNAMTPSTDESLRTGSDNASPGLSWTRCLSLRSGRGSVFLRLCFFLMETTHRWGLGDIWLSDLYHSWS